MLPRHGPWPQRRTSATTSILLLLSARLSLLFIGSGGGVLAFSPVAHHKKYRASHRTAPRVHGNMASSPLPTGGQTSPSTATRPEDVPAIISRVASQSSAWRQAPVSTKLDLLRQILANTEKYGDEWTKLAMQSRGISPTRIEHGCARADVYIGSTATMGSYVNGLIAVLEHCEADHDQMMPPRPTKVRRVRTPSVDIEETKNNQKYSIATVWPRTLLDKAEGVGLRGELVLLDGDDDHDQMQMSLSEAYGNGDSGNGSGGGGVAGILGAGNVDAPIELLGQLFLRSRVCVYKPNPVNALQGTALQRILQPLVDAGCLDFVHGGADVGAALVSDPRLEEVVLTGTKSTYDKIRPLVPEDTPITAELGGVNAWIVVPDNDMGKRQWTRRTVDDHARHMAFARLANNGHVCAAPQVILVDEEWPWRQDFVDRLRYWMAQYAGAPPFYPGSDEVHSHFRGMPGADVVVPDTEDDAFIGQQRPVIFENVDVSAAGIGGSVIEEGGIHDVLSREAFCPVIAEVPLPKTDMDGMMPLDFLRRATKFAQDNCYGSLSCNILIPDAITKKHAQEFDSILAGLPFGIVGVNVFPALAHSVPQLVWGAPPGHGQSGYGFIGNAGFYRRPQKAILRAPFRWIGRKCLCVMPPKKTEKVFRRLARYKMRQTPLSQAILFSALFLNL